MSVDNSQLKILLIGPGHTPIPPKGWGACESIVWDYYLNLKDMYNVEIINTSNSNQIVNQCNSKSPDIVHIMYDEHINIANRINCKLIFYTSHFAYITSPNFEKKCPGYFNNIFKKVIHLQKFIYLNALSEEVANVYIRNGFDKSRINILRNGAREDVFSYKEIPNYMDKSVYVGKIETRKRQYKYQSIPNIDFVGNYYNSPFNRNNSNYLGEWNKETLYENLTNYSNLILLSDGEADPLVVKEALTAGLGVVVSECAKANLDLNKSFIDIIPNDKINDLGYVQNIIEKNRGNCKKERSNIRKYGLNIFSWKVIIDEYISIINKLLV